MGFWDFGVLFICVVKWYKCYKAQRQIPGGQEHSWSTFLAVRNFGISIAAFCRHTENASAHTIATDYANI